MLVEDFSNIRYFRDFEMVPVFDAALHINFFLHSSHRNKGVLLSKHHKGSLDHFRLVLSIKTKCAAQEICCNQVCPVEKFSFNMKNSYKRKHSWKSCL